ncbi:Isochorismatase hydrolase [Xylariaceae sp. FL0016]|nr:Isochorismatase hydrolase [Xylariaceae sp. FL0016]
MFFFSVPRSASSTLTTKFTPPSIRLISANLQPHNRFPFAPRFSSTITIKMAPERRLPGNTAVFVCDMQEKFRNPIWQFDKILLTTQKVLRAAQILKLPVYVTTQNGSKLGPVVPELSDLIKDAKVHADKTLFSMMIPEVAADFPDLLELVQDNLDADGAEDVEEEARNIAIVGIESHVCVTQTAMDLLNRGHHVYVLADGVSSCNEQEVPLALARLRQEGAIVTTSESFIFECMGDAGIPEFRDVSKLIKETSADTKTVLGGLLSKM